MFGQPLNLLVARDIAEKTFARFVGQRIDYFENDCGKMVIFHLRENAWGGVMGSAGDWRSKLGLRKFLKRNGGSGAAALDGWGVPRIAPARSIVGDIIEMPGEPPFGAFGIALGNGRVLGWSQHEEAGDTAAVVQPLEYIAAWRP